jgi:hypothetical protein
VSGLRKRLGGNEGLLALWAQTRTGGMGRPFPSGCCRKRPPLRCEGSPGAPPAFASAPCAERFRPCNASVSIALTSPSHLRNRWAERSRALAASTSRYLGGAAVSKELRRLLETAVIPSTAARKAASFAFDGLLKPLTLRTNCSEAARISSSVTHWWSEIEQELDISTHVRCLDVLGRLTLGTRGAQRRRWLRKYVQASHHFGWLVASNITSIFCARCRSSTEEQ